MMTLRGKVQSGVVVFDQDVVLPDGTEVMVLTGLKPAQDQGSAPIWKRLAELGRQAEGQPTDLPPDLASNHDHYLHGLPKRP